MQQTKKNIISTWVYLDGVEEKSNYPNNTVKADSSSVEFQAIYWRCVVVFFATSLRFHEKCRHLLFTNANELPKLPEINLEAYFKENNIEIIQVNNKYPLPKGYHANFRNQFFEFSIIEHVAKMIDGSTKFLMLDSDCIFTRPINDYFAKIDDGYESITYIVKKERSYLINGMTGEEMKAVFSHFGVVLNENPYYSGGEALFANGVFLKKVAEDFPPMFQELIKLWKSKKLKFNEEAHVLSFFYYKYNAALGGLNTAIKRMWTNRNYYRNIHPEDTNLPIWHLPNEKGTGFERMYTKIASKNFSFDNEEYYLEYCENTMLNPKNHKLVYYKRLKQLVYLLLNRLRLAD